MNYTVEIIRAKDGLKKVMQGKTDGTDKGMQKCINSYDLFYKTGLFKAYKIIDENGNIAVKKGNI